MRAFILDFSTKQQGEVAKELQKRGIEILYWTGARKHFHEISKDKVNFPNVVFHDQTKALQCVPAEGIDASKFFPPSADLLKDLLECESTVLTMMTRFDFKNMPLIKKKHLYYKHVQYWNGLINKMKPDVIIFTDIPHFVYNYVLYSLAKLNNIPVIMVAAAYRFDELLVLHDYKKAGAHIFEEYERIKNEKHEIGELSKEAQEYYLKSINPAMDSTPVYKKLIDARINRSPRILPKISSVLRNLVTLRIFHTTYYYIKSLRKMKKALSNIDRDDSINYKNVFYLKKFQRIKEGYKKEYENLQVEVDFDKKYLYFPLHFQPECTTSPQAGVYVDQILIVKTLAASLPDDWLIYIKEYAAQWDPNNFRTHLYRYEGYYEEMAAFKNVRLISPEVSTFDLIKSSQAVVTAAGTAGWEALVRTKPVLLFGYPWYMHCDGVFHIDGPRSCREAIQKIIRGSKPDPQKIINYLIALEKSRVKAAQISFTERFYHVSMDDTVSNLVDAISNEIKNLTRQIN